MSLCADCRACDVTDGNCCQCQAKLSFEHHPPYVGPPGSTSYPPLPQGPSVKVTESGRGRGDAAVNISPPAEGARTNDTEERHELPRPYETPLGDQRGGLHRHSLSLPGPELQPVFNDYDQSVEASRNRRSSNGTPGSRPSSNRLPSPSSSDPIDPTSVSFLSEIINNFQEPESLLNRLKNDRESALNKLNDSKHLPSVLPPSTLAAPTPYRATTASKLLGNSPPHSPSLELELQRRASNDHSREYRAASPASSVGSNDSCLSVPPRAKKAWPTRTRTRTEAPKAVNRRGIQRDQRSARPGRSLSLDSNEPGTGSSPDEFSSLRLQGGDITRPIYRWAEDQNATQQGHSRRMKRFTSPFEARIETLEDTHKFRMPGGFRRNFIRRGVENPTPSKRYPNSGRAVEPRAWILSTGNAQSQLFATNFLRFVTPYGRFTAEDLEEDDEFLRPDESFSSDTCDRGSDRVPGEETPLLTSATPRLRRRQYMERTSGRNMNSCQADLRLFMSLGTGALFLPRAFLNGGILFSSLVLIGVAILSFHCSGLLINTRHITEASFDELGGIWYGKWLRILILSSIVLSQIGVVSTYIAFSSENLQAFILAVSKCKSNIDIKFIVLMQLIILLPLNLIRDMGKLRFTILLGNAFPILGLFYLYYNDIITIVDNGRLSDIRSFNPSSWTLFVGIAIFAFQGIEVIIPIGESTKSVKKTRVVLAIDMVISTILFTSIGALSYAAYGSKTKTVILLNLPQDSKLVNTVQFLYSLAILLIAPLQLFPAICIVENELFNSWDNYDSYSKWQEDVLRFFLVCICALIAWGVVGDLDKFVALVGGFACIPLMCVYPPLLHLKAVASTFWQRWLDYLVCLLGLVGCVYITVSTIQQWAAGNATQSPGYCD